MSFVPASAFAAEIQYRQAYIRDSVAGARRVQRGRRTRKAYRLSGVTYLPVRLKPDHAIFQVQATRNDGSHERISEPQPAGRL